MRKSGSDPGTSPSPRSLDVRVLLGAAAALVVAVLLSLYAIHDRRMPLVLFALDRGQTFFWAALICWCACSGGMGVLRLIRCRPARLSERVIFGAGLGLGAVSIITLLLGLCGLMSWGVLVAALLAFSAIGLRDFPSAAREFANWARERRVFSVSGLIWTLILLFFLMNMTRTFEPPSEYDALEYHFGAPATWRRAGRITFLERNVYSNMPLNAEMFSLLGMGLEGDPLRGATLGRIIGVVMGLLGAAALAAALWRIHSRLAGDAAAIIYYSWPGVTLYAGTGHIEVAQQLYGILALWAVGLSLLDEERRRRWGVVAGVMAGLALGVKYPSAVFVLVPVVLTLLATRWAMRRSFRAGLMTAATAFVTAILIASPWLIRNVVNTGNPVYPLLYNVFGGSNWSALQDARWRKAHSPGALGPAGCSREVAEYLSAPEDHTESALLFAFLPLLLLSTRRDLKLVLALLGYAAFCLIAWIAFTHRADRFLAPAVPALAALGGVGVAVVVSRPGRTVALVALIAIALAGPASCRRYLLFARSLPPGCGLETPTDFFERTAPAFRQSYFKAMEFLNDAKNVPHDAKVLFFPDARVFWLRRDVIANTPFDRSVMEEAVAQAKGDPGKVADFLRGMGITHALVNNAEVYRLTQRTPGFRFHGRIRKHIMDSFDRQTYARFAAQHMKELARFGKDSERPALVLYRLD